MDILGDWEPEALSEKIKSKIKHNWDSMAKPLDSMGRFEDIIASVGAVLRTDRPDIHKRALVIMCADNGVVEEGISQSTQEVTGIVARDMGLGKSNVCHMAESIDVDVYPVDIGINSTLSYEGVLDRKVAMGTRNLAIESAMTMEQLRQAISVGMNLAKELKDEGYTLIATGEMGIGNTTTSSIIAAALMGLAADEVVGRGAGLSDIGLNRKRLVVKEALDRYSLYEADIYKVLSTCGGLDIAGLTGVFLGGARYRIPIVIDGVISLVAALTAEKMKPGCREYMIASHQSREPASRLMMKELKLSPCIDADMALGEGTGAVMMIALLDMVMALYDNNRSFEDINIKPYERYEK